MLGEYDYEEKVVPIENVSDAKKRLEFSRAAVAFVSLGASVQAM